jgi:hypothetical protein
MTLQTRKSPAATGLSRNSNQPSNHNTSRNEFAFMEAMRATFELPHIDATSWRLLVELSADVAASQAGAEHTHHRSDLQRITAQLDDLLQRFDPPKGAA